MNRRILAFLLLLVATFEEGRTAPTASNSNSNTTVALFKVQAKREVYSVSVEIHELEAYTVRYCITQINYIGAMCVFF